MAYPLAPWIGPPESITKSFATGLGIASDIANQRAKLDADEASQQLMANLERQKMAQQAQYQQAGLAQDAQRLAMEQQAQGLKAQEAQTRFDALQRFNADMASGMDPIQAAFRNLPGTGDSLQGIGALARQLQMQKNYQQPLPPPGTMVNPANQQKYGMYYTRGTEGEPEPSMFPTTQAKVDPYELALFKDELKGYDDDIKRAEDKLTKMELDPAIQASLTAEKPNAMAQAQRRAYQKAQNDVQDAVKARDTFRASRPYLQQPTVPVAPPGAAPPGPPSVRTAPPGAGAQFTYDPSTGKIVPRGQPAPTAAGSQGGGTSDLVKTGLGALGQAAWPQFLRPSFLAEQAKNIPRVQFPGSGIYEKAKTAAGAGGRAASTVVGALESALSPKASHLIEIPKAVQQEMLDSLSEQQLYDLYVSIAGKAPALKEGTREELVDLIRKLQKK